MFSTLETNPLGINIGASIATGRLPSDKKRCPICIFSCEKLLICVIYFTRFWGILSGTVLAGVGIDFVYHQRIEGYWLIAYAVIIFIGETLWVCTLFLKITLRLDHKFWKAWKYCTVIDDWKKSPLYIFIGFMTMYKPYKLRLVYLAGGLTIALGILHLFLSIFRRMVKRSFNRKENRTRNSDMDSLESKFEEITEVLDDCIPEPIPGSSISLSDSLLPDRQDAILEI
ncbi:uncharacterized protein LOC126748647 isoform X2 [Anthonomus grandis grandis]|uniref:uncharacterized protein LOC126748647 isoform X2 n=1 Tax=Anthonomus grandis grandis TaxID=2921223 RepID=UPI0021650FA3|nr:uncharacterized protein LOC126748647 isoform X2 [Anthonomus grandis grandis]